MTDNTKERLGVLWVLLNVSTEIKGGANKAVAMMDLIEKTYPEASTMYRSQFEITVNGKKIFTWDGGNIKR